MFSRKKKKEVWKGRSEGRWKGEKIEKNLLLSASNALPYLYTKQN